MSNSSKPIARKNEGDVKLDALAAELRKAAEHAGMILTDPPQPTPMMTLLQRTADAIDALKTQVETLTAENTRLHTRLEDNFAFIDGKRVEMEPGSIPDGIECRDETIKLLDAAVKRATARAIASDTARARAEAALAEARVVEVAAVASDIRVYRDYLRDKGDTDAVAVVEIILDAIDRKARAALEQKP